MIINHQDIRNTSTLDVLSQYVKLEKSGMHYKACCPFHGEKTPSFIVDTRKNNYVCYGCGASGDGVSFMMDHEGMSFPEALEHVAKVGGVEVEYQNRKLRGEWFKRQQEAKEERTRLQELMDKVVAWYCPWDEVAVEDYLKLEFAGRTFGVSTLRKFNTTIAFDGNELLEQARSESWSMDDLEALSLINRGQKGRYDYFRNRSLFPITDHRGKIVGWGGRKPKSDTNPKNPKYLNSKASLLYNKRELVYGLYQSRQGVRSSKEIILCEGYTDVMTLHDYGVDYAVATCGTALSAAQAQLIKRYTDNVIILRDGDEAGRKAARYDVRIFVQENIVPKVVLMPDGEDPDSFIRQYGRDGLLAYIEAESQDGILWSAMLDYSDDPFIKDKCMNHAGELISFLKSETLRNQYVAELGKAKRFGSVKRDLTNIITVAADARVTKKSPLTEKQQQDVIEYGVYEHHKRYFTGYNPDVIGQEISNFIIDSKMLIIGAQSSLRVVDILNEHNKQFTLILDSRAMTSFNDFKIETERMGNFLFFGDAKDFMRIRRKIYENTDDVFPLNTMGWNRKGFYVWGNGVSHGSEFVPVNEYGVVEVDDTKYFLPAFSKIGEQYQGDDGEDQYEFEKKFVYYGKQDCVDFRSWSQLMHEVHGHNGAMAVAYYCAALFYDIIFSKYQFFPLLNAFGPSGSGKTWLARSVMAMFGRGDQQDPFNLASGTPVAFKRRLAQVANAIIWFDEYSNDVDFKRIEALKGAYDGAGHQKGVATQDNRVVTTKIRSALMYIGQQQATKDIALQKRSITLNCSSGTNTLSRQRKSDQLKGYEKTGQLTQITQYLLEYRSQIEENFSLEYDQIKVQVQEIIADRECDVEDRIVNNYVIPVATLFVLSKAGIEFGFDIKDFLRFAINGIIDQSNTIQDEDELNVFWRIVQYMAERRDLKQIRHYEDFIVEERTTESFQNELNKKERSDSRVVHFDRSARLLYIRFSKIHPDYQERHKIQRGKSGLDLNALQYYLKQSPAYLGQKRNKKFDRGKNYSCWVFDMDQLSIELPLSIEVSSEELSSSGI